MVNDLAVLVGQNARRLRLEASLTLDQVARAARARGLRWTESRVADFESGRVSANLGTLIAACMALSDASGKNVTLPDFVSGLVGGGSVHVNDGLVLTTQDVHRIVQGLSPVEHRTARQSHDDESRMITSPLEEAIANFYRDQAPIGRVRAVRLASGAAEARTARDLEISPMSLAVLSAALWRRSFSGERDKRAGANANAQQRGRISRILKAELREAIKKARDGND
ncbi:XRE family transcriptional regulator [Gordonia amicalis]|uniref:XRE family transcriptional regulator n=1 Tax=Gordonia amicalis TaxID=89053 RepID=UPI00295547A0|nr:XRE family transcriptional regulator [Gordonia amicalis]MDV7176012.1 XRE family transcriptional regulator [Gordonia amicalis]